MVSRFGDSDFDDKQTEAIGAKLLAAADALEIKMHRDGDKVWMRYEINGTFGVADDDDDLLPRIDNEEARLTARQLMRGFLGE